MNNDYNLGRDLYRTPDISTLNNLRLVQVFGILEVISIHDVKFGVVLLLSFPARAQYVKISRLPFLLFPLLSYLYHRLTRDKCLFRR